MSLPQGPLVANLLRFQKIVQPRWLFDVVETTLLRKGGKKKRKKKEEERRRRREGENEGAKRWSTNKQLETWTGSKQEVILGFPMDLPASSTNCALSTAIVSGRLTRTIV